MSILVARRSSAGGGGGGTSDLAVLAASMSPNSWATFSMGNLTSAIFTATGASDHTCAEFASRMMWDSIHKRLYFAGTSHTGGFALAGSGGFCVWDDATNTWSRETYTWNSDGPGGHGYAHSVMNPLTGDIHFRQPNSRTILTRAYGATGQASWETGHVTDIGGNYGNQFSGGLEWFPELNSGAGGLVFVDTLGANWTNAALSSWTGQAGSSVSGDYDNNVAYANGFVYWGGGSNGTPSAFFRLSPNGTVTSMTNLPFNVNQDSAGSDGVMLASPNNQGVVIFAQPASGGNFQYFNGSAWTNMGSHQNTNDTYFLGGTIKEYGVCLFVSIDSGGSATPVAKVWKQ